ncbi:MAG: hypothetical protein KJ634_11090 [Gammaproteobacteria bacterium]|nr:hypothetical protein [Gammaproteobacteria bacterium]MBU1416158.1 hypothetical protein [Gammaproteobacteria bacterium]
MTTSTARNLFLTLFLALTVAGCGGGGGSTQVAGGGTGGTGVSYGSVTGYGSVFVNGIEFNYDASSVSLDDDGQGELKIGMVVRVHHGDIDDASSTGTADDIEYEDNVKGPIASITSSGGTFPYTLTVAGQTIIVDGDSCNPSAVAPTPALPSGHACLYDSNSTTPIGISDLAPGEVVEISGLVDGTGAIRATYIEREHSTWNVITSKAEVKGRVSQLDTVAGTFRINDLTVGYSGATTEDLPGGSLSDGDYVEVKGTIDSATSLTPTMTAEQVQGESEGFDLSDSGEVEIEGYVSELTTSGFKIGAQEVDVSGAASCSGITVNTRIEVEGSLVGGVLMARDCS